MAAASNAFYEEWCTACGDELPGESIKYKGCTMRQICEVLQQQQVVPEAKWKAFCWKLASLFARCSNATSLEAAQEKASNFFDQPDDILDVLGQHAAPTVEIVTKVAECRFELNHPHRKAGQLRSQLRSQVQEALTSATKSQVRINYMLPIRWAVAAATSDARAQLAERLDVRTADIDAVHDKFGWSASFCTAFFQGSDSLAAWMRSHCILPAGSVELGSVQEVDSGAASGAANAPLPAKPSALQSPRLKEAFHRQSLESDDKAVLPRPELVDEGNGIKQLWLEYSSSRRECVALLVTVPTRDLVLRSEDGDLTAPATKVMGVELPGVQINTTASMTLRDPKPVQYEDVVLTLPRVHFLLHCAEACAREHCGLELHGVHGTGKSSIVRALVGALAVGGDTNTWMSSGLPSGADTSVCLNLLVTSTGQLMDGLSGQSPDVSGAIEPWLKSLGRGESQEWNAWRQTNKLLQPPTEISTTSFTPQPSVVAFDEVNELLKNNGAEASRFFKWSSGTHPTHLRIQAASPDSVREECKNELSPVFFELRPAPALHMAALLSVAPNVLLPSLQLTGNMNIARLLPLCEKLGSNMRELKRLLAKAHATTSPATTSPDAAQARTGSPDDAQARTGGPDDAQTRTGGPDDAQARTGGAVALVSADSFLEAMVMSSDEVYSAYVLKLSQRMRKPLSDEHVRTQALKMPLLCSGKQDMFFASVAQKYLSNASLLVRKDPTVRDSTTRHVASIAADVLRHAVHCLLTNLSQPNPEGAKGDTAKRTDFASLQALMLVKEMEGGMFEDIVAHRLAMRVLSRCVIPFPELASYIKAAKQQGASHASRSPTRHLGERVQDTPLRNMLSSEGDSSTPAQFVHLHKCDNVQEIGVGVLRSIELCRKMKNGGVVIIQTAHRAPFCDFIVYRFDGKRHSVACIEATISKLSSHSAGKAPARKDTAPQAAAAAQSTRAPSSRRAKSSSPAAKTGKKRAVKRAAHGCPDGAQQSASKAARPPEGAQSARDARARARAAPAQSAVTGALDGLSLVDPLLDPCKGQKYSQRMVKLMDGCPPALKDVIWLLGRPKYKLCKNPNGSYSFRSSGVDSDETVSVANAWLALLQAPFRFELSVARDGKYHVNLTSLRNQQSEEDLKKWDASVAFVSNVALKAQCAAKVERLVADNVFCVCREHLELLSTDPVSAPSSPEK